METFWINLKEWKLDSGIKVLKDGTKYFFKPNWHCIVKFRYDEESQKWHTATMLKQRRTIDLYFNNWEKVEEYLIEWSKLKSLNFLEE